MVEKRLLQIDGLRGIAIIIVLLFHFLNNSYSNSNNLNYLEAIISKITSFGWVGVNLFFVISGFLIGSILLKNKGSQNYFRTFYFRRFLRIIPLYYTLLVVFVVFNFLLIDSKLTLFENPIPIWQYFLLVQNFSMSRLGHFGPNALTPTWSLAIEEQFYLIAPIMIYLLRRNILITVAICLILCSCIFRMYSYNWYMEYTHFFSRVDSLLIGLLIAILNLNTKGIEYMLKAKNIVIYIFIFLVLLMAFSFFSQINHTLISYFFGGVLIFSLSVNEKSLIYKILVNKATLFFGKYSYFIYLFHQLINGLLFSYIKNGNPVLNTEFDYLIEFFAILLTMVLATISFKYLESKFILKGQSFSYE
jgi:peptidoglycan/LPS O-acetylase OafA/YrhL